jgi:hypothetical protein
VKKDTIKSPTSVSGVMKNQVNSLTPSPNSADNVQKTLFLMPKPNRANAHANFQDKSTPIPMHASVQEVDSLLERSAYAPMKTRSGTEGSALDALPEPPFSLQINSATTALKALRLTQLPTVACLHSETDRFVFVILTIHKTFLKPLIEGTEVLSSGKRKRYFNKHIIHA